MTLKQANQDFHVCMYHIDHISTVVRGCRCCCIRRAMHAEMAQVRSQYKEVEENSKRTGRANQTWKFHEQIAECIADTQSVNPAYTFDTEMDSSSSSTSCNDDRGKSSEVNSGDDDCDDDSDCRGKRSKTLKNRRRSEKAIPLLLKC